MELPDYKQVFWPKCFMKAFRRDIVNWCCRESMKILLQQSHGVISENTCLLFNILKVLLYFDKEDICEERYVMNERKNRTTVRQNK
jgi:hypothetical protein